MACSDSLRALSISNSRSLLYSLAKATPVARITANITASPSTRIWPPASPATNSDQGRGEEQASEPSATCRSARAPPTRTTEQPEPQTAEQRLRLEQIDDHRQKGGGEQDLDDRLVELLQEFLPDRLARQRSQSIGAEELPALGHGGAGQSLIRRTGQLLQDVGFKSHTYPR